jgi:lipoyl-dependent peroxiredoxin
VPRVERAAEATWHGNVARGEGTISAESGAFEALPISLATRIGAAEGRTSPEELLAAAHAGCYAMSLASELAELGMRPERLEIRATVTLDDVSGGSHRIVGSHLHARARVEGLDDAGLDRAAEAADTGCPFSALVKASGTVTVNAELEGGHDGD